jgi:hypothetical protein
MDWRRRLDPFRSSSSCGPFLVGRIHQVLLHVLAFKRLKIVDGQTNEYMRWKKHAATRIITRIQLGGKIKDDIYIYILLCTFETLVTIAYSADYLFRTKKEM